MAVIRLKICLYIILKNIYAGIRRLWGIVTTQVANLQFERNLFLSSRIMDPKELFLLHCNGLELYRPGITIRYLAVKDIVNGKTEDGYGLRLYKKFILGGGNDDPDFHVDKFNDLVKSFADRGYDPNYCLFCDNKMEMIDGSHRLTCALFFGEKRIRVNSLITSLGNWDRVATWGLVKDVFSGEEIDIIRNESDRLVESVINDYKIEYPTNIDHGTLRKWIVKESKKIYNFEFYQSFPMLGLNGARPTDVRIEQYGLKELLNSKMDVLDIGCHIGFFDLEIASLVHSITGIELNPKISRLSLGIARKLSIYNAAFFSADFKEWESMSRRKYDMIFSFANYREIGLSSQEFVAKIVSLIKPSGYVLFEGYDTLSEANNDYEDYIGAFTSLGFKRVNVGVSKDQESVKRTWTLLQQNE
ncbi:methyltransferase domain-containing protein [uncultured Methanobrevibacter sp.]|uniref:methyltransferase domain-containing protein n=1 Tax=uncultured Methanobrevibacter sp. TaxID=253161 RepID=UPI00260CF8D6|nr:methyltransferase domain-containing protein [uncultured Methanobrevibacter sp.]